MKLNLIMAAFLLIIADSIFHTQYTDAAEQQKALEYIVDTQWLKTKMASHNNQIRIIDVRDQAEFKLGHIPGASNFPVEMSFEGNRIVSIKKVRSLLREIGLQHSDILVLYDDGHIKDAAHVFWMLETYGHKQVLVLDGGLPAWQQAGFETNQDIVKYPPSRYTPTITSNHLTTKLGALLSLNNPNVAILDSRQYDEFSGAKSRAQRAGHIPGALNISSEDLLNMDLASPQLKKLPELQSLFRDIDKSSLVMTYCNRGKDSAMSYLIMRSLGYKASVYDGGWLEWGNDMQLPIE